MENEPSGSPQGPSQDPAPELSENVYSERSTAAHLWYETRLCLGFLTRVPVFSVEYSGHSSLANASWAFPVVGIAVGLAGAIVLWLAGEFGLAGQLSALIAIACITVLTGALHEDGLADTADGLGLSGDSERRLSAMRDSHIGVFGMVALIVVFGARWTALGDLSAISISEGAMALIAATTISRGVLPYVMHTTQNARSDGLSFTAGRPDSKPAAIALAICAVIGFFAFGFGGTILVAIVVGAICLAIVAAAKRLIGGQTGDILGAIQQITEAAILVAAVGLAS